jgi:hypothetical protein
VKWPDGRSFAFAIVDDTDGATVDNVAPVYDLLAAEGISATKTVWVEPARDGWAGQSLADPEYLDFIRRLQAEGFEIALHGVGSGAFSRQEILDGLDRFRQLLDDDVRLHSNHSRSPHNVYWGHRRFVQPIAALYRRFGNRTVFEGEDPASATFWGDRVQEIDYVRNLVFNGIDTLRYDRHMPYREASKPYSKYWFSSSDGETVADFNRLIAPDQVDKLERSGGACVVYTHFASGFVQDGRLDPEFTTRIRALSRRNGWFVPASELLDHLRAQHRDSDRPIGYPALLTLNLRWAVDRVRKRLQRGR